MTSADTTLPTLGLESIADSSGVFSIIAMDQRNTLRRMFVAAGFPDPTDADLARSKADVARVLTPLASGILFDPTIGVPAVLGEGALAETCGLIVAAEPEVRTSHNGEPRTRWEPSQDGAWVRRIGGHAVKFLVNIRADRVAVPGDPDISQEVLDVSRQVSVDAHAAGLPAVIENLIYTLPGEEALSPQEKETAIIEAARALNDIEEIDLLKLEYPGSAEGCRKLASVLTKPWAVLSAGVAFDQFQEALAISFDEGGASGFIAGRSVWKEAVGLVGPERETFLQETARPRLETLVAGAAGRARPWTDVVGAR